MWGVEKITGGPTVHFCADNRGLRLLLRLLLMLLKVWSRRFARRAWPWVTWLNVEPSNKNQTSEKQRRNTTVPKPEVVAGVMWHLQSHFEV